MADQRELLLKVKVDDDASKPLKRIGDAADDAADDLKETNLGLKKLDDKVAETTKTIADLRAEIARTGDLDLIKDVSKQEARLKALERQRKVLLGDPADARKAGKEVGENLIDGIDDGLSKDTDADRTGRGIGAKLSGGIVDGLGNLGSKVTGIFGEATKALPPQVQAAVGAAVGAAAVGAAGLIGAAVAGAVVGGVGVGGVIGGIKIAAQSAEVKAAAKVTGDAISDVLEDSASAFVPATVDALGEIRSAAIGMGDDLERIFDKAATYLPTLTKGATGFVENLLPGVEAAVEKAGPIIDELASWGPKLGTLLSDVLRKFSELGPEGARALELLFDVVDVGVRTIANHIEVLAVIFGRIGEWWDTVTTLIGTTETHLKKVGPAGDEAARGLDKTGEAAAAAAFKVETLKEMVDRLTGANISAERANIALEEAIDRAAEAGARSNAGIDISTAKGRENRQALIGIADAARTARDAVMQQTGSQELANAAMTRGREQFLAAARAMNVSEAEAIALANALFGLPDNTTVKVTADTKGAQGAIDRLKARIDSIERRININAKLTVSYGGSYHTGQGYSTGYSQGGPVHGPGPKGVDSKMAMLAPGEHVVTADEVDAAGGHQAIEAWRKSLRAGRSATGTTAVAGRGGGAQRVEVVLKVEGNDRGILAAIIKAIRDAGGNPGALGLGGVW
ncbi:MAG TPA: hypothetical protein VFR67_05955 [Pilimelia sp.]|nr:hypothetical protein [Pilimelia sp.]